MMSKCVEHFKRQKQKKHRERHETFRLLLCQVKSFTATAPQSYTELFHWMIIKPFSRFFFFFEQAKKI